MKKVLFVFNPHAGKGSIRGKLPEVFSQFSKEGYRVEVYASQHPQDLIDKVARFGKGKDLIVASGGDGTLNEVITAIMRMEEKPKLGYLPTGTTNDFAATHKIPKDFVKAMEIVTANETQAIDIGTLNDDRYFAYVAGFGAFTDIPYKTSQDLKAILGHPAYVVEGAISLKDLKPTHTWIRYGEESLEVDALIALVSNSSQVGGFKRLSVEHVELDDGLFETLIIEKPENPLQYTEILTALIQGNESHYIHRIKSKEIEFRFEEPVQWVLDGEFGGEHMNVSIKNHQKAIHFIKKI